MTKGRPSAPLRRRPPPSPASARTEPLLRLPQPPPAPSAHPPRDAAAAGLAASTGNLTLRDLGEATGSDVVGESDDASRARLGEAFADALLPDQTFLPSRQARELGRSALGPTLVDYLGTGSYSQNG